MKPTTILLLITALFVSCGLTACQTLSDRIPLETKSRAERDIAALNVAHQAQLAANQVAHEAALKTLADAKDAQAQGAADAFYAIDRVFGYIPSPLRTDVMTHNYGLEGWKALGNRMPSYAAMVAINERITIELDTVKTSMAQLQSAHDKVVADNGKLVDAAKVAQDKVDIITADKTVLETEYHAQLAAKEKVLNDANDKVIATEKARADDSAAIQALKTKVSIACGLFALACAAGAIYSPIGKGGLAALGAVVALAGAAIWVITGTEVLIAVLVLVAGLVVWGLSKFHTADKGVTAFANLIHEKPELVPAADEWASKYVKDKDGNVTTVPDVAVQALVKSKLIASDKA